MRSSERSGVFALTIIIVAALGGVSIVNAGQTNQFTSVSTHADGQLTANGLVTPLDNEGKNFYLRNEDGLIEVRLTDDAIVGLLFRVKKVREQYERREIVIEERGQTFSFRLPQDLYVKVRFADWEQAQKALTADIIQGGKVYSVLSIKWCIIK